MRTPTFLYAMLISTAVFSACANAQPADTGRQPSACFYASQFEGWKAPDDRTLFIRIRPNRFFRLDLASTCSLIRFPDSHLVTVFHGSDTVCTALDWDLKVVESPNGIPEPCIVKAMHEMSAEEIKAIPPHFRP